LLLNQLANGYRCSDLTGKITFPINRLELTGQDNRYHAIETPCG